MTDWTKGPYTVVSNMRLAGEIAANAHLIAAAPDLYAALQRLVTAIRTFTPAFDDSSFVAAEAALAKARGVFATLPTPESTEA